MEPGRKLRREHENPVDNLCIDAATWLNVRVFRPLRFTPNGITTLSLLLGLASAAAVYRGSYVAGAALVALAYLLDCADGSFARMYGMTSKFGDWYDHVSDVLKFVCLFGAVLARPGIPTAWKWRFAAMYAVLAAGMQVHLGCQELVYRGQESGSLHYFKKLCPMPDAIAVTRWFGCGTFALANVAYLLIMARVAT